MISSILVISCLLILIISLVFSRSLMRVDLTAYGLLVGAFYFLFFPLLVLLFTGTLEVPWWLKNINIGLRDVVLQDQDSSLLLLFLYLLGILLLFLLCQGKKLKKSNLVKKVNNKRERRIYFVSIVLYFIFSVIILISSDFLSGGHWYETRVSFIREQGLFAIILHNLIWSLRFLIVAYTFELMENKSINSLLAIFIVVVICMYELMYVGNRVVILMFGLGSLLFIYKNYGIKKLAILSLLLIPIALIMSTYQHVRAMLFRQPILDTVSYLIEMMKTTELVSTLLTAFEYTDTVVLFNLLNDVGKSVVPLYGDTFVRFLTWFIPRSVWADRPLTITILVGNLYVPGVAPVPLITGEFHYNFYYWGLLLFPFLLFLIIRTKDLLVTHISYTYYLNFLVGFTLFRLPISEVLTAIMFAALLYLFISQVSNTKKVKIVI